MTDRALNDGTLTQPDPLSAQESLHAKLAAIHAKLYLVLAECKVVERSVRDIATSIEITMMEETDLNVGDEEAEYISTPGEAEYISTPGEAEYISTPKKRKP